MNTVRNNVFATGELLEAILSFLPFKNLFYIKRVSKRWAVVIDGSVSLQQKMFLRPRDQLELWILERKHRIGAHRFRKEYAHLNDTGMRFRRVETPQDGTKTITPVTLNPMLQKDYAPHFLNLHTFNVATGIESEVVTHSGWTEVFWDGNSDAAYASFWNTFLTGPPCHQVSVERFAFRLDDIVPPSKPTRRVPVVARAIFSEHPRLTVQSSAVIRMRDILLPCLTARGCAEGELGKSCLWICRGATVLDAAQAMRQELGSECIAERWGMFFHLRLDRLGPKDKLGSAQPLIATDRERAAANEGWNQLR